MQSKFEAGRFFRDASLLVITILGCNLLGMWIASNGRMGWDLASPTLGAFLCGVVIYVPGIALRNWRFLKANRFLAALAWRLPASLAAIPFAYCWEGVPRKCFVAALLTCYFVALLLESWLQTRQCAAEPGEESPGGALANR